MLTKFRKARKNYLPVHDIDLKRFKNMLLNFFKNQRDDRRGY